MEKRFYGTRGWGDSLLSGPKEAKSGNRKEKHYVSGDGILKQNQYPYLGYAVKEVFFRKKGNNVYAIPATIPQK